MNYWTGRRGIEFEKSFAEWQGSKYAISFATGTAAFPPDGGNQLAIGKGSA